MYTKASENAGFLPRKAYFVMLQIPRIYFVLYFKTLPCLKMWIGVWEWERKNQERLASSFFLYIELEHSRLWMKCLPCGRICVPEILGALSQLAQAFRPKGRGSFRSALFASRSNLQCFKSPYQVAGDVKRMDNLLGFQGLNAQLPYLAEGCSCKLLHSPLWTSIFVV